MIPAHDIFEILVRVILRGEIVMKWEKDLRSWLTGSKRVLVMGIGNPLGADDNLGNSMIDAMKKTTKVQRDIKVSDIFDLAFVKKASEELKASGWKP